MILSMIKSYTAKYTKIDSGYMGQLIEWPEVVTEGDSIEECRSMLRDALREMVLAYRQLGKEIPLGNDLFEQVSIELEDVHLGEALVIVDCKRFLPERRVGVGIGASALRAQ
jgi:predicted RNase H-like HicB family nuclease